MWSTEPRVNFRSSKRSPSQSNVAVGLIINTGFQCWVSIQFKRLLLNRSICSVIISTTGDFKSSGADKVFVPASSIMNVMSLPSNSNIHKSLDSTSVHTTTSNHYATVWHSYCRKRCQTNELVPLQDDGLFWFVVLNGYKTRIWYKKELFIVSHE